MGRRTQGRLSQRGEIVRVRLDQFLSENRDLALTVAHRIFRSDDDAEDALQEACIRTINGAERYDPDRPFRAWFLKIVLLTAMEMVRARQKRGALNCSGAAAFVNKGGVRLVRGDHDGAFDEFEVTDSGVDVETDAIRNVLGGYLLPVSVQKAIAGLSERQRRLLSDRFCQELTLRELAQLEDFDEEQLREQYRTIYNRLRRAIGVVESDLVARGEAE